MTGSSYSTVYSAAQVGMSPSIHIQPMKSMITSSTMPNNGYKSNNPEHVRTLIFGPAGLVVLFQESCTTRLAQVLPRQRQTWTGNQASLSWHEGSWIMCVGNVLQLLIAQLSFLRLTRCHPYQQRLLQVQQSEGKEVTQMMLKRFSLQHPTIYTTQQSLS